ncbi:MAG: ChrB domain-containing protein [Devosia sp.]|nr:ChrB domain-containing protein [Devosia sp.]
MPKTEDHQRRLKLIENEIAEMGGEALLFESTGLDSVQDDKITGRFNAERDESFREFIERCEAFEAEIARESAAGKFTFAELEENDEDLKKLQTWLEKIRKLDFCQATLGPEANDRLGRCVALLDEFAQRVFDAQAENRPVNPDGATTAGDQQ